MPDQRFRVLRILGQRAFTELHAALQPRRVAGEAGEEVAANDHVEPGRRILTGHCHRRRQHRNPDKR